MKKLCVWVLVLVLVFSLAGCKSAGHEKGMVGEESALVMSDEILMHLVGMNQAGTLSFYRIQNPTDVTYTYGADYMIEVFLDGKWHTTNYGPKDVTAEGRYVLPGAMADYAFEIHNTLPEGKYRYIKKANPEDVPNDAVYIGMEFHVGPKIYMPAALIEEFSSLEEFEEAALTGQQGAANMAALYRYCLPTGIPENYQLYKVTVTGADIAFWYLPAEELTSRETIEVAEDAEKHFKFIDERIRSPFANNYARMVESYGGTVHGDFGDEDFIPKENPNLLIMKRHEEMFFLYMPEDYVPKEYEFGAQIYTSYPENLNDPPSAFTVYEG